MKPENVLWSSGGGVLKVTDFGLAHTLEANRLTRAAGYPSPKVMRGDGADLGADVHSVGVMLRLPNEVQMGEWLEKNGDVGLSELQFGDAALRGLINKMLRTRMASRPFASFGDAQRRAVLWAAVAFSPQLLYCCRWVSEQEQMMC